MSTKEDPESGSQPAATPAPPPQNQTSDLASAASKSLGKGIWTGAAVGIGSAAIVAALLYARKKG